MKGENDMKKIRSINIETKEIKEYNSIQEASKSIKSKMLEWKIQLNIAYALILLLASWIELYSYKCKWEEIK